MAGYGPTVTTGFLDELHYVSAFNFGNHTIVSGLAILAKDKRDIGEFKMQYSEIGCPVVDPVKRLVVGVLSGRGVRSLPKYASYVPLAWHRNWTNDQRRRFNRFLSLDNLLKGYLDALGNLHT